MSKLSPQLLDILKRLAEGIVAIVGPTCEVVVHDFADLEHSVVVVAGNVTGRSTGAPVPDLFFTSEELNRETPDQINYRTRLGEIDIIAEQGSDLVFIEVKTRASVLFGSPLDAVNVNKQKQLSRVALDYMSRKSCQERPARFDVVGIVVKRTGVALAGEVAVELVQDAFDFHGGSW